ncbi:hypothetical protein Tco_0540626 [Tanacetum coccineum]
MNRASNDVWRQNRTTSLSAGLALQRQMASANNTSGPTPQRKESVLPGLKLTPGYISSGLVQNLVSSAPYVPPSKKDYEILFQPLFDEYFNPPPRAVSLDPIAVAAQKLLIQSVQLCQLPLIKMYHLLVLRQQIRKLNLKSFFKLQETSGYVQPIYSVIAELEDSSMVDIPIHQEDLAVQRTPLIDPVILMVTEKTASTPTPPTTQAHVQMCSTSCWKDISRGVRSAGWCKENSDGQKNVAEDSTPPSMCQTISNIDAHVEGEQFHESKQSRNPVKENPLKEKSDLIHRTSSTDLEEQAKMEMEIPRSQWSQFTTQCSHLMFPSKDIMTTLNVPTPQLFRNN